MKKIHLRDEDPTMVISNEVGRRKSALPYTSKATDNGVFLITRSHSRAHKDEELSDACSTVANSKTKDSASKLKVSVYMDKPFGHGGVSLIEVLQWLDQQYKIISELRLIIQVLVV